MKKLKIYLVGNVGGVSRYCVTPCTVVGKNRTCCRKHRYFLITSGVIQDDPTFRRYIRRLRKIGYSSWCDNMYWNK